MNFIIEALFELIIEGSIEVFQLRNVPKFIRFLAGLIIGIVYGGLLAIGVEVIKNGFIQRDLLLASVGAVIVTLIVAFAVLIWRKCKRKWQI